MVSSPRAVLTVDVYGSCDSTGGMPGPKPIPAPGWNADRLQSWLESMCGDAAVVVLANRAPFQHTQMPDGRVIVRRSSDGLVNALEPLLHLRQGVWVAQGTG